MTRNCDVTNTTNTNDHHMALNETPPMKILCGRHCIDSNLKRISKVSTLQPLENFLRTPMAAVTEKFTFMTSILNAVAQFQLIS